MSGACTDEARRGRVWMERSDFARSCRASFAHTMPLGKEGMHPYLSSVLDYWFCGLAQQVVWLAHQHILLMSRKHAILLLSISKDTNVSFTQRTQTTPAGEQQRCECGR